MIESTWPCDLYQTHCTYHSKPNRLTPRGFQILTEVMPPGFQVLTESISLGLQTHAWVNTPGLVILTKLVALTFQPRLD